VDLRAGSRLCSVVDGTEVIVVRPPTSAAVITCGGEPMLPPGDRPDGPADTTGDGPGNGGALLGKRYSDEESGVELLCTKPGSFPLVCDGRPLQVKEAKPLPASD
jgi:hypothetical protein